MTTETSATVVRLDSLTGARAYFAVLVFTLHAFAMFEIYPPTYDTVRPSGEGIAAFFLLSGFVMAWSFSPADTARKFWRRRFARIYPAYVAAWIIAIVVNVGVGAGMGLKDLFSLTLLQTWIPDSSVYFATSVVFWSLSVEAFFYLLFPFIIRPLVRLSERGRLIVMGVIGVVYIAKATVGFSIGGDIGVWLQYIFPPVLAADFVLGILLCLQFQHRRISAPPLPVAVALMVVTFAFGGYVPTDVFIPFSLNLIPCVLVLLACVRADVDHRSTLFTRPLMTRLGNWSYGMYLIHASVLTAYLAVLHHILDIDPGELTWAGLVLNLILSFCLSIAASSLVYRFVEQPMNALLKRSRTSRTGRRRATVPSRSGTVLPMSVPAVSPVAPQATSSADGVAPQ